MQRTLLRSVVTVGVVAAVMGAAACSSPDLSGPSTDPAQLPWELALSAHAITMDTLAPYDTLQLTATTRTVAGDPLPSSAVIAYASTDSSVRVSETGLLKARRAKTGVKIIASVVYRGVRIADTATVNVTASAVAPPAFAQVVLQLFAGDSAKIAVPNFISPQIGFPNAKTLQIGAYDASHVRIPNSVVALRVADLLQASLNTLGNLARTTTTATTTQVYVASSARIGVPMIVYTDATVYGVTRQDSIQIQLTPELLFAYTFKASTPPGGTSRVFTLLPQHQEVIGVGGFVWWVNTSPTDSMDVVFDDPSAASPDDFVFYSGGGDIAPFTGGDLLTVEDPSTILRSRQFLQAGTFPWHSPLTGLSGTVIVQ